MISSLHQVALGVRDLDVSTRFFEEVLSLPLLARFDPPGLAFFALSGTRLLLERSDSPKGGTSVLYLRVEGIESEYERLQSLHVEFAGPPQLVHIDQDGTFGASGTQEWMAFFEDPDGNALALVEARLPETPR